MLLFALFLVCAAAAVDPALVDTDTGPVKGLANAQWRSFRGIPFAAPPLGKLRWAPPAPPASWGPAPLDATDYRHNCIQSPHFDPAQPRATLSEDCLYLNVFTPPNATSASRLPVMVWVHGGGYSGGGSNESRLNATFTAALTNDMVVVVTNYRLNVFGFLGSKQLRQRDAAKGGTGNYGILDQRAALQWTQRNIHSFGGDAARVMLAGESAGGASVHNHLVRPASYGLYSRAVIESGGYTLVYPQPEAADMEDTYDKLLKATACSDAACLEGLDADALLNASSGRSCEGCAFQPAVDGVDLTAQVTTLFEQGAIAPGVPLLVGSVREDLGFTVPGAKCTGAGGKDDCTEQDFAAFAVATAQQFGTNATALEEIYADSEVALPGGNCTKWYWAAKHAGSDATMICPARRTARWMGGDGKRAKADRAPAFLYVFAHAPNHDKAYPQGAFHSSEIPFVFHVLAATGPNADKYHMHGAAEVKLSASICTYWRNFASSGDPNVHAPDGGADMPLPAWPAYDREKEDSTMVFGHMDGTEDDGTPAMSKGLKTAQCDFWDDAWGWSA